VVLTATANGPAYGFTEDQQTEWTFTFTEPAVCGDLPTFNLPTLALTGENPAPAIAIAGLLSLLGAALVRTAAGSRRMTES
jgi:LPXTG-motif cell wall-anchored protein